MLYRSLTFEVFNPSVWLGSHPVSTYAVYIRRVVWSDTTTMMKETIIFITTFCLPLSLSLSLPTPIIFSRSQVYPNIRREKNGIVGVLSLDTEA